MTIDDLADLVRRYLSAELQASSAPCLPSSTSLAQVETRHENPPRKPGLGDQGA
jgi:hypothetical protein